MNKESGNKWVLRLPFPIIKGETLKYQYKFVVNPGEKWLTNDNFPKENDDKGNVNNVLEISGCASTRPSQSI